MKKILAILPVSIGGRLTTSSIIDGFVQNDYEVTIFDELKNDNFEKFIIEKHDYIIGYDYSPIKLKADYKLNIPLIAYFSDDINLKTSGVDYIEYKKYLSEKDNYIFYWDRELSKKENLIYQPHFVNTEIYKNFKKPKEDILFIGRLDTNLRLNMFIELNKKLSEYTFGWYAIEKHYQDALNRLNNDDKKIIKNTYKGFIDNEKDMANIINDYKITYNINAQGLTSLNYRTIQVLACERLIISDDRKELDLFNNLIPTYKNVEDLAYKIDFYLKNKIEYNKITRNCYKYIIKNHSAKLCVRNMLNLISKN